jgi:hypothetical protein
MKPYYLIFNSKNKLFSGPDLERAFNRYSDLAINSILKESIKQRIYSEQDFEITMQELQEILPTLDKRIEELLKQPDFNPFKEELRQRFPQQYGNQPFEYKGTTYYLYHKGREFYIDSLIYGVLGFKKLVEEYIKANKPLKYVYKK